MLEKRTNTQLSKVGLQEFESRVSFTMEYSRELDLEYLRVREEISANEFYLNAKKHTKIRLKNWLGRLDSIIANPVWKKNRNRYVKLINLMCQCEVIIAPFNSMPPAGDVPNLTKHEMNKVIDWVERAVKNEKDRMFDEENKQEKKTKNGEKPEQYWEKIKSMRHNSTVSYRQEENSSFVGRFSDFPQRTSEEQPQKVEFLQQQQQIRGNKQPKNKQNSAPSLTKQPKKVRKTKVAERQSKGPYRTPPKHVSIHFSQNSESNSKQSNYFVKNTRIKTEYLDGSHPQFQPTSQAPIAHRDNHESIDIVSQTLITEILDQTQSINQQSAAILQETPTCRTVDCNFNQDLSERCRTKDQVMVQNYFGWKTETVEEPDKRFRKISKPRVIELNLIPSHPQPLDSEFRNISVEAAPSEQVIEGPLSKCAQNKSIQKTDSWKYLNQSIELFQPDQMDEMQANMNQYSSPHYLISATPIENISTYAFNHSN